MLIGMAIGATLKFDFELRVLAPGNVALRAQQFGVSTLERIIGLRVVLRGESRRLESLHCVARGTLALVRTSGKLALVRIGFMAVHALGKDERLLEIPADVAFGATDFAVLAQQRVLRLGMIEVLIESTGRDLLPSAGIVTSLASLLEAAVMRVRVTIGAFAKRNSGVARLFVGAKRMAFGAGDFGMQSSQRIASLGVIELATRFECDRLPIGEIVALQAVLAKASLVMIFVASRAGLRQPEERLTEVFYFDRCPI